jgi:hypothetical protein
MTVKQSLFSVGRVTVTPGALELMGEYEINPMDLLLRHVAGDWGDLDEEDKKENDFSVTRDLRILSAYKVAYEKKLWIITEADRSSTTILLPAEY